MTRRDLPRLLLLAAFCALPPLSIDMGLPSLPVAAAALGVDASRAALTVTVFMAGFAVSPIVYGALSDAWGRRPLLITGLALFAAGGLACLFAPTLGWLLFGRLVQGMGAGCGPTLAFAATRDRLTGRQLGARLALLTTLLNTAPVIAPSLGAACLALGGWRGVYAALAMGGTLLLATALGGFEETQVRSGAGEAAVIAKLRRDVAALSQRRHVLFPGLVYGLSAGSMFAYVSTSPLLLMQRLGASPALYAGMFAVTGTAIVLGALLSGRTLHRVAPVKLAGAGLALAVAGPIGAAGILGTGVGAVVPIVGCMAVATFGYGLVAPVAAHATLDPVPDMAGTASALMNSVQMTCMALASLCASLLFGTFGSFAPSMAMVAFALTAAGCLYGWWRRSGAVVILPTLVTRC
jgi:DHA1 family bicyclomycin/chloramphenicol resistance-like MFS transporter